MTDKQQEIFNYFAENHGLTLTVSEIDDIREVCLTQEEKTAPEMVEMLIKIYSAFKEAMDKTGFTPTATNKMQIELIEKATGKPIEEVLND
jgi:hypothetical protein